MVKGEAEKFGGDRVGFGMVEEGESGDEEVKRMEHLGQNKENNLHRVKTITYGLSVKKGEKRSICCNLRL